MTMKSEFLLPYYTAQNGSGMGMFNTAMGKLQRQLHKGEYDIFKYAPIFESDFIQITKRGEVIDVHNRVRMVTVGIACTSPILPLPDVMLLARPAPGSEDLAGRGRTTKGKNRKAVKTLELTRLLPLKFVRISIHNHEKQQLRLKFATGRSCYLQLCPPLDSGEDLFAYWEKLIYLLRPPVDSHSSTYAIPAEDIMCMPLLNEDQRKEDPEQVSIRSLQLVSNANAITSAVYTGGEGIPHDTQKPSSMPCVPTPQTKATELSKESATGATAEVVATGGVAGTLSVMADRSADSGQVNAAIAGGAATGSGGSRSHMVFAGTGRMSPNSMKIALAGATGNSKEYASHVSTTLSTEDSIDVAIARVGLPNKSVGVTDPLATPLKSTLPSGSFLGGQAEQQRDSQASVESHKEKRERRERREKDRAVGRRGEGRHKRGGEKIVRKSSSHRAARDDKKERGSPRGNRHSSSHKGVGHIPIAKDSRSSHRWGRSVSTTNSSSTSKRHGRISSFLRSIRANFTAKGLASQRGRDMDIMTQTVERTNMEAIMEGGESGQSLDIIGSVTSEVTETMTIETH